MKSWGARARHASEKIAPRIELRLKEGAKDRDFGMGAMANHHRLETQLKSTIQSLQVG